jgi:lysozyme family protein
MKQNFDECLNMLLAHEGGFSNHSQDPGGMTNLGVTKAVYEAWVGHPVDEKKMRALTPADVAPLYRKKYWNVVRGDELQAGLDYTIFDYAVNSGNGRAIKALQSCVGVPADGAFGPKTFAAVAQFKDHGTRSLIEEIHDERLNFLKGLKTWPVFGRGWERRVKEVKEKSLVMSG